MQPLSGLAGHIRRALGALALACYRHAVLATLIVVALGGLGTWSAKRLVLDPDVTQLLPPGTPSVVEVERLRQRFGGVGYVVLLLEGGSVEARRAYADAIAPELAKLPTVKYVDEKLPRAFFEDRALYFADLDDLRELDRRLEARRKWEVERAMIDLDDEPAPSVDVSDLEAKYRGRFESLGEAKERASAYHEDAELKKLAIFVRPTELASDLDFSKRVVADVESVIARMPPSAADAGLRVELTGRYKKRVDLQAMLGRDLARTSMLALGLLVLYLALHFRRVLAVLLVLAPLYLGIAMSYGVAGVLFGKLNILTAFIGAILLGIGIDNGLHMLGRFDEERREGRAAEDAVKNAFGEAGRVSLAAALTTASAFIALTWTDFRAFREFGVLAAMGMLFVLLSYVTLLPALLGLLARFVPKLAAAPDGIALPGVPFMKKAASPIGWLLAIGAFLAATQIPLARFDADFSRLDDADLPSFRLDKEVNRLLGRSQTPMVILADTEDDAREAARVVRDQMRELGDRATVGLVTTRADLLPSAQEDKRAVLERIAKTLRRFQRAELDDDTKKKVDRLERMVKAAPFGAADLPDSLRHVFEPKPGSGPAHFVLLYPTVSMGEAEAVKRVAAQLRHVPLGDGRVLAGAGEAIVMADVLLTVERDAPRILGLTLVLVLAALWLALGKLRLALLSFTPAALVLVVTVGLLPVVGLDLNYLNMIILPILLGIGVDDGAHLVSRVEAGEPLVKVWQHTGWDVTGAILTDVFGFGVLALAAHPGLASLGKLAMLGLAVNCTTRRRGS
jgi:predicted RND superfamily exporter protein